MVNMLNKGLEAIGKGGGKAGTAEPELSVDSETRRGGLSVNHGYEC